MLSITDYIFLAAVAGAVIWGLSALLIGGILRFNLSHFTDSYVEDVKVSFYSKTSSDLLMVSKTLGDASLGSWSLTLGGILIAIGLIILGFAAAGFVSILLKNATALFVSVGLILIAFILEFVFLWLVVDIQNTFNGDAKDDLAQKIKRDYQLGATANQFSKFLNAIMIEGNCCGSKGYEDFSNMTIKLNAHVLHFSHSPACCSKEVWRKIASRALEVNALENCITKNTYNQDGCYDTLFKEVSNTSGTLIVAMLALLMIWEAAVGGLAVCLLFRADAEMDRRKEVAAAGQAEESAEVLKEFTPYSKMSSSENVIGITKSTEIW